MIVGFCKTIVALCKIIDGLCKIIRSNTTRNATIYKTRKVTRSLCILMRVTSNTIKHTLKMCLSSFLITILFFQTIVNLCIILKYTHDTNNFIQVPAEEADIELESVIIHSYPRHP